jgi:hypothetical protein
MGLNEIEEPALRSRTLVPEGRATFDRMPG